MTEWCREHDVLHLVLGHHADDQSETVLMQRNHGSRTLGLAGMAGVRWALRQASRARLPVVLPNNPIWVSPPDDSDDASAMAASVT